MKAVDIGPIEQFESQSPVDVGHGGLLHILISNCPQKKYYRIIVQSKHG